MPKCEQCPHWQPRTGSVGWCPIHKCARKINDSCSEGEIVKDDYWGDGE